MDVQEILYSVVNLECKVFGSLPMEVQWSKDGHVISSEAKYKLAHIDNTVSLEINYFNEDDTGEYSCNITNKVGSCECSGALKAKGWDEINSIDLFNLIFEYLEHTL